MKTCALCRTADRNVRTGLIEWREPIDNLRFEALPRCVDRVACRARVEARGERWPAA